MQIPASTVLNAAPQDDQGKGKGKGDGDGKGKGKGKGKGDNQLGTFIVRVILQTVAGDAAFRISGGFP